MNTICDCSRYKDGHFLKVVVFWRFLLWLISRFDVLPGFMVGSIAGYQSPLLCPRTSFLAHI